MAAKPSTAPLIVIVGETASGKSALAIKLAQQFNGEIIAADSWTVYKGFDIGTAKPTADDRKLTPHHLLDIADPNQGFSAALYKTLALETVEGISSRGKLPIMVGGTGLYVDSVLFNYGFLPPGDPAQREKLNSLSLAELLKITEDTGLDTSNIDMRNKRRVIRLIENNGVHPTRQSIRPNSLAIGLKLPRDQLKSMVAERVQKMFAHGLEQEVKKLSELYGWQVEAMKGIGYREFQSYFNGSQSLDETKQQIIKSTLDLAKRQRTWLRRNKSIHWVDKQSEAVELTTTFLNKQAI
jgi:tRNA dimethylallyltransferase